MSEKVIKDSIAILLPCANSVEPKFVQHFGTMISSACKNGYQVSQVGLTERTLIHSARNWLAQGFLETDCEWGFWIDSDMILPSNTISVMINWAKKLNAQFLTGIYYKRLGNHAPLAMVREDGREYKSKYEHSAMIPLSESKQPFKVHATGFGCVLTHRDMFEKLKKPYFKYINEEDCESSEDFYFCVQAREAGIDLWAIPELDCGHLGEAKIVTKKDCVYDKDKMKIVKLDNNIGGQCEKNIF